MVMVMTDSYDLILSLLRSTNFIVLVFISVSALFFFNSVTGNERRKALDDFFLKPCPNPDCARCQRYNDAQMSARRRLPYLLQELKKRNIDISLVKRVTDGVYRGPIQASKISGQYPSVLFVPKLSTYPISTLYHEMMIREIFEVNEFLREDLLNEYLDSQDKYSHLWRVNNSGATDPSVSNIQLWQVLYLMNQGRWIDENANICPKTKALVTKIPTLMNKSIFGNVFFSVLFPGTRIEQHCGPTNVRHRLHFPIYIPKKSSSTVDGEPILTVQRKSIRWEEGKVFVFDDSLMHSVEYPDSNTSEVRVVLVVDVWHPELSLDEQRMISELFPY